MGFFFGLIGYLTAISVMVGGAIAVAAWVTRPVPEPTPAVTESVAPQINGSAKRMRGASAALTLKQHALPPRRGRSRKSRRAD
jgi:hypothetical protein